MSKLTRNLTIAVALLTASFYGMLYFTSGDGALEAGNSGSPSGITQHARSAGDVEGDRTDTRAGLKRSRPLPAGDASSLPAFGGYFKGAAGQNVSKAPVVSERVKEAASNAMARLLETAETGDKSFLTELKNQGPNCEWCDTFYGMTREAITDPDLRSDLRANMALALTQSGRAENINRVAQLFTESATNPDLGTPQVYGRALDQAVMEQGAVDEIAKSLSSDNPYIKEAAVSVLTRQGTPEAARQLYQHTLEVGDTDGYYRDGMGLGLMKPKPETIPYLEQWARSGDAYSHLAIKALLNYGNEGLDIVAKIMNESGSSPQLAASMLRNAVDHIARDQATLGQLKKIGAGTSQPAMKDVVQSVFHERQIEIDSRNKQIEYNENFEKGIVTPVPTN